MGYLTTLAKDQCLTTATTPSRSLISLLDNGRNLPRHFRFVARESTGLSKDLLPRTLLQRHPRGAATCNSLIFLSIRQDRRRSGSKSSGTNPLSVRTHGMTGAFRTGAPSGMYTPAAMTGRKSNLLRSSLLVSALLGHPLARNCMGVVSKKFPGSLLTNYYEEGGMDFFGVTIAKDGVVRDFCDSMSNTENPLCVSIC